MVPKRYNREALHQQAFRFAELLGGGKSVLVSTHQSPDGDAVASLLAGAQIVERLGGRPLLALDGVVPTRYQFMPRANTIINVKELNEGWAQNRWDAVLILDSGSLTRIGAVAQMISAAEPLVNIDHHADNTRFGVLNILEPEAASTTEILFEIVEALDLPLDSPLATALYTGLMTDTGGFRFSNTGARTFEIAARLTAAGANPAALAEAVYGGNPAESIRLLGQALTTLELFDSGRIAVVTLPGNSAGKELEDVTDYALAVKGVKAAVFLRSDNGNCRGSLRLQGEGDVSRIARRFGGGGHPKAAGFTYHGAIEEIRPQIVAALAQEIENPSTRNSDAA